MNVAVLLDRSHSVIQIVYIGVLSVLLIEGVGPAP
jgi:hypothetical protein